MSASLSTSAAEAAVSCPVQERCRRLGMRCLSAALSASLLCIPGTGHAAEGDASSSTKEEQSRGKMENAAGLPQKASSEEASRAPEVIYEKKTVLDFSDVTLEGELTKPEGSYVLNRQKARFDSLVETRKDFVPELDRTADEF